MNDKIMGTTITFPNLCLQRFGDINLSFPTQFHSDSHPLPKGFSIFHILLPTPHRYLFVFWDWLSLTG